MSANTVSGCELCDTEGGAPIFRSEKWRVVRVTGAEGDAYPGFCRVIWNAHVKELTDLSTADRRDFMDAVFSVESTIRKHLSPHKMNIASLGNLTPHLHWHVIPRYANDPAFPKPIWAHTFAEAAGLDTLAAKYRSASEDRTWEQAVRRALESC